MKRKMILMFLVLSIIGITSITASADEDFMLKAMGMVLVQ